MFSLGNGVFPLKEIGGEDSLEEIRKIRKHSTVGQLIHTIMYTTKIH
jgi:hypothetical protein